MADRIDITAIIPAYNAEPTLGRLLESVQKQTFSNFEVLIVNDGSKDDTQRIIDEFCAKDPRFRGFHKENGGVSSARNMALDNAKGKYIVFYDSDDTVPEGSMQVLFEAAEENNADLVVAGKRNSTLTRRRIGGKSIRFARSNEIDKYDPEFAYSFGLWNKMFRRDIIEEHHIRFESFRNANDGLFVFNYLQYCDTITGRDKIVYEWRKRLFYDDPSISQIRTLKGLKSICEALERVKSIHDGMLDNDGIAADDERRKAFDDAFYYRIANVTFLDHYYRHMWLDEDEAIELAVQKYQECRDRLSDEMLEQLESRHSDLSPVDRLLTKEEILKDPSLAIVVADNVSGEWVDMMLDSLFDQQFPYFVVYVPEKLKVRADVRSKANFRTYKGKTKKLIDEITDGRAAEFLMLIDEEMYFDSMMLRALVSILKKDPSVDVAMTEPYTLDIANKTGRDIGVMHELYNKKLEDDAFNASEKRWYDQFHVNKVIRVSAMADAAKHKAFMKNDWSRLGSLVKVKRTTWRNLVFVGATEEDVEKRYNEPLAKLRRKFK